MKERSAIGLSSNLQLVFWELRELFKLARTTLLATGLSSHLKVNSIRLSAEANFV